MALQARLQCFLQLKHGRAHVSPKQMQLQGLQVDHSLTVQDYHKLTWDIKKNDVK